MRIEATSRKIGAKTSSCGDRAWNQRVEANWELTQVHFTILVSKQLLLMNVYAFSCECVQIHHTNKPCMYCLPQISVMNVWKGIIIISF